MEHRFSLLAAELETMMLISRSQLLLLLACLAFTPQLIAETVGKRQPDVQAIAEVADGKRAEVRVVWWGFDPEDATAALQAAIDSGARKVIVEDMGAPWITGKLTLASDQEIVFEKGVIVQAKRGEFHGLTDSLFSAILKKNIKLTGAGATLRMWKQDYDDKAQYKHSEWRHVLSFKSCAGVSITGLTLADSGGDGIYLGVAKKGVPCSDVVIKNVVCQNNYRQGISVISARNLLIEDCVLKDTWGTPPAAGIDFEPNGETEELVNCVIRNCVSENNKGDGYAFYLPTLNADSEPLSIKIENCRSVGCRSSISLTTGNNRETAAVKGSVEFIDCRLEGSDRQAISINDKSSTGAEVSFVNCEILNPAARLPEISPITFSSRISAVGTIGGVRFNNCTITDPQERRPMSYTDAAGGVGLKDITGTLIAKQGEKHTKHELTPEMISEWMPHRTLKQIAPYAVDGSGYEPVLPDARPNAKSGAATLQRGHAEWLLWADADESASFTIIIRSAGTRVAAPMPVSLVSPSGKVMKLADAKGGQKNTYEFKADERGAYKIVSNPKNSIAFVDSAAGRVSLYSKNSPFHFFRTTGQYFFWVPPGSGDFAVKISGDSSSEAVKATLLDPAGQPVEVKDNISQWHQFVALPKNTTQGEIWSLQFEKPSSGALEDFYVDLQGIPPLLSPTREGLLKPLK
jgi:hypothetical protein